MVTDKQTFYNNLQALNHHIISDKLLKASWLETPVGSMIAIGDEQALYVLDFAHKLNIQEKFTKLLATLQAAIIPGTTSSISSIEAELASYFAGTLQQFKTPLHLSGTPFQKSVWQELMNIPYGQTISYAQLAAAIARPHAHRAVANANGANHIAIVIPCHRIINSNGNLGGYAGGISCKKWLIEHERAV